MATCQYSAQPDMYGLGIRVAFYVQWFGFMILDWFAENDLHDVRFLGLLLSAAGALGLIIQLAGDHLRAGEIYVVLLLIAGYYFFLVPVYIWKALTLCNPYWNLTRWQKERVAPVYKAMNFVLVVVIAGVGIWFYTTYLPDHDDEPCSQYGFFFGRVSLKNTVYIAFNAVLYIMIAIVCLFVLFLSIGTNITVWAKTKRKHKTRSSHIFRVHLVRAFFNVAVFSVLVAAVEMSVYWNDLQGSNNVNTLAQTIPLILSAGIVIRAVMKLFVTEPDDGSSRGSRSKERVVRTKVRTTVIDEERGFSAPPPPPPPPPVARPP